MVCASVAVGQSSEVYDVVTYARHDFDAVVRQHVYLLYEVLPHVVCHYHASQG